MVPGTCKTTAVGRAQRVGRLPCRAVGTDAAVDPGGVVVLLGHARVTAEAVLRPDGLLDLRTRRRAAGHGRREAPMRGGVLGTHHARRAEDSGVETAGLSQQQHVLTAQTKQLGRVRRRPRCTR